MRNILKYPWLVIFIVSSCFLFGCTYEREIAVNNHTFKDFGQKIAGISNNAEKQIEVDKLIKMVSGGAYPLFENETTVVLLWQTKSEHAYVLGDMGQWADYIEMSRIDGTDLFFYRGVFENDARLEYWLCKEVNGFGQVDSLNPYKTLNGFGPMSELAMPGYKRHPYFNEYLNGQKGSVNEITKIEFNSKILNYKHDIYIYTPSNYEKSEEEYPIVLFQDGLDYIEFAQSAHVIERLIVDNKINPIIAIFIPPPNRFKPEMPNRMTEYGLNDNYVQFLAEELVPYMDTNYRTLKDPHNRLVIGDSFGGLISAYIPWKRPDVFALGYSQSGYQSFQNDRLINYYKNSETKSIRLFVDVGRYERKVGSAFLPADEQDFLMANRRFKDVLDSNGYDFVYREYNEGHTWGNWRRHQIDALIHFFGHK